MATGRSHPPTLETLARRLIADERLIARGDRVMAAVSGGPDSTALLHVLARLRKRLGFELLAHGVDHGLRAGAATELDGAEALARELDVPFGRTSLRVPPGGNLQARAREARLGALKEAAEEAGARTIATAHHADDRAETVLIRLLSGSGPLGLSCMAARSGEVIRPFLLARKRDILAHVARHALPHAIDPSNRDPRFLRARVRAEVLPMLEGLSPSIVEHLNGLADDLARLPAELLGEGLGRAQRRQAARGGRRGALVRMPGGGDALVSLSGGRFVITGGGPTDEQGT